MKSTDGGWRWMFGMGVDLPVICARKGRKMQQMFIHRSVNEGRGSRHFWDFRARLGAAGTGENENEDRSSSRLCRQQRATGMDGKRRKNVAGG
jgi:hypothetical protein